MERVIEEEANASQSYTLPSRSKIRHSDQNLSKSMPAQTHGRQKRCSKNERIITIKMNNETVTKAICNKGFRGNSSILPRIKFRVSGQESSPQSLTAYSLSRCIQFKFEYSLK